MKTTTVAKKLVLDEDMDAMKLRRIFQTAFASEKGLTKRVFVEYHRLYPRLIERDDLIRNTFDDSKTFMVTSDTKETCTGYLINESDNHGHDTSSLKLKTMLEIKWIKIYSRPDDLTLEQAFTLARCFKNTKGVIILNRKNTNKHKHTLVGHIMENVTFSQFCEMLNKFYST